MSNLFINENNISLIWEILSENPHFVKFSDKKRDIVFHALKEDMVIFCQKYKAHNLGILDLNKKFLSQITNALKLKDKEMEKDMDKEKDIRKDKEKEHPKKSVLFEESLERKKKELQEYLKIDIPPQIDFSDKVIEEKISNIDELMQHVINERNFDVHSIKPPESILTKPITLDFTPSFKQPSQDILSSDKRFIKLEQQMEMVISGIKEISYLLHQARNNAVLQPESIINNNINDDKVVLPIESIINNEDDEDDDDDDDNNSDCMSETTNAVELEY